MIMPLLLFCSYTISNGIEKLDGIDSSLAFNEVGLRRTYTELRKDFDDRIKRISDVYGMSNWNIIMEYKSIWRNSIITILFSHEFVVVANTHNYNVSCVRHKLNSLEQEKIATFLSSKYAYRYFPRYHVFDLSMIYVYYLEDKRVVSVHCFDHPSVKLLESVPKKRYRGTHGDELSEIAYEKFVDVFRILTPMQQELQNKLEKSPLF